MFYKVWLYCYVFNGLKEQNIMKEAIRILEAAKERNIMWMERLGEDQKEPYIEKNKVIDKAVKKLTIPVVVSTSFCDTVECSNCGLERAYDGCIVCGES